MQLLKTAAGPQRSLMDINNTTCWVTDYGLHEWIVASSWNGAFPKGMSVGAIYSEGILWGGQVNDGSSPLVRVNGNDYGSGTYPLLDRVYRVRPDYQTADLTDDAANFNNEGTGQVSQAQIDEVRAQYAADWKDWPADQGAIYQDVNGNGKYDSDIDIPGIPGASQTLFIKYDDRNSVSDYGSAPIGLTVTETYWAYAYTGALGNVIFKKVNMVYSGTSTSAPNSYIDSLYIVQWADPDVGNSTDDFAGCDTSLNLGYAYSSHATDAVYDGVGLAPPAVGYDFLQGVSQYTGNPSDSAIFNLQWHKGFKYVNPKPMSSFIYFASGGRWSDPPYSYLGALRYYNLMRGYLPIPSYPSATPFPDAVADVTPYGTYLCDGDPVTGTGKIDGAVDGPGDRRIMVINGPLHVKLHDSLEVVTALVYGLGSDNLSSVAALKTNDASAQIVYDRLFQLPNIAAPNVQVGQLSNKIVMNWGNDLTSVNKIENFSDQGYDFEGYDVYQLKNPSSSITDPVNAIKVATFDKIDGITNILDSVVTADGVTLPVVVENGKDKGIQRYVEFTTDQFTKQPLKNGQAYYYAVVAYAFNPAPILPFHSLKSPVVIKSVVPQSTLPGVRYSSLTGDTLKVTHSGNSDGRIVPIVVDPSLTTGDTYKVSFDTVGGNLSWYVTDVTTGKVLFNNQTNQTGDDNYLIAAGIMVKVLGANPAIKSNAANEAAGIVETDYNGSPLTSKMYDAAGAEFGGNAVWHGLNSAQNERYYVSAGGGNGTLDRLTRSIANAVPYDYKLIFTDTTSANPDYGVWGFDNGEIGKVPFQLWRYDPVTGDSVRLIPVLYTGGVGTPGYFGIKGADGYFGYNATDWIYWYYDSHGYDAFATACKAGDVKAANNFGEVEYFARMIFGDYDGDGKIAPPGTVVKIVTTKPNSILDSFTFTAPAKATADPNLAKADANKINVFPNPYYGYQNRETSRDQHYVTFSHLPANATIRVFDLSGVLVKTINKHDPTQFTTWNLQNDNGYPVSSGIYVAYIDMPDLGTTKILKIAILQEQQILKVY